MDKRKRKCGGRAALERKNKIVGNNFKSAITAEEAAELENLISTSATIDPLASLPGSLIGNIKTQAEMKTSGWFPEVNSL